MKKIYFYTFGCKVNQYDTQEIRENLNNFCEVNHPQEADLIVVNSCSVTAEAERQCRQIVRKMLRKNSHADVVVCGCYARRDADELKKLFKENFRVKILKDLDEILSYYNIPKTKNYITKFSEHSRAYIKIQDGCDQFCSYCVVPFIRNKIYSKPQKDVINEIEHLLKNGYLEIVLCGVRLGKYNPQKNYFLEDLISDLLKIKKDFRIRLSSIEITEISQRLLELMSENKKKICPHLHIPLQSGDDEILRKMNRPYDACYFEDKIKLIRKFLPEVAITTDVIVGFPGETDETFKNTVDFVQRIGFSKVHIFPYSERPQTAASKLNFIRDNEYFKKLKKWKSEMTKINEALQKKARKISESRPHQAIPIADGWILTEDYQYYRCKNPPNKIFVFHPRDNSHLPEFHISSI